MLKRKLRQEGLSPSEIFWVEVENTAAPAGPSSCKVDKQCTYGASIRTSSISIKELAPNQLFNAKAVLTDTQGLPPAQPACWATLLLLALKPQPPVRKPLLYALEGQSRGNAHRHQACLQRFGAVQYILPTGPHLLTPLPLAFKVHELQAQETRSGQHQATDLQEG
eukprot:1159122-Pelagomonas_calceolata.AAC.12